MCQCYGRALARSIALVAGIATLWAGAAAGAETRLCVLVPHFKDEYWLSVGYGLEEEARRHGVDLMFFEAGGYRALQTQIAQLEGCLDRGADAVLIGAVSSDHPALLAAVSQAAVQRPVFGLVNALDAPDLAGRVGVDWADMGRAVGRYLAERHPLGTAPRQAVLISGPAEAGWTGPLETGLRDELAQSAVRIVGVLGADTGLREQLRLVEDALDRWPGADFLIGSAPAIEAAMGHLAQPVQHATPRPGLVATYSSHTIKRGLIGGQVLAAPFDDPMEQGRLAVRQAIGLIAVAHPDQALGPEIRLLQPGSDGLPQMNLSPPEYFPMIE
ncbi:TMAO reductase system periplasmic protein TorT [Phaeovulum sp. NW3]|uniref:TMAO reductase system periplasmic protein TorT n=1 Tax=Phaeovulum sp. NW3 TaxID=2934933 RepID=UPI00202156BB|nr:TMAO reductase system periplasmic protein TorT [Phaeovulum sp. NW3]MCL7465177.1 TMAO reductase system periplasmic protein TorT [Phaeovulum sp. NW3]